ncbi:hypothetical protein [Pantoea allii]|uniref:hypothetical protein n=1 Tax=Pantoea allii TaxID=574096 RepID=UPI001F4ED220|nr:hypothetical protein [Pantoea allii]MCH9297215.1 hypothetical protein [Pantoea allii]
MHRMLPGHAGSALRHSGGLTLTNRAFPLTAIASPVAVLAAFRVMLMRFHLSPPDLSHALLT